MQQKAIAFFNDFTASLTLYDYLGFVLLGLFFIFFIILSIVVRKKPLAALFFGLFACTILVAGPLGVKEIFDRLIRSAEISLDNVQKLHYSNALIIEGSLQNSGKIEYSKCSVHIRIYQDRKNKYLNYVQKFLPLYTKKVQLQGPIAKMQSQSFETTIEQFNYSNDYKVNVYGECYP